MTFVNTSPYSYDTVIEALIYKSYKSYFELDKYLTPCTR